MCALESSVETQLLRRSYRYRLEPTPAQGHALLRFAGARRFVWNWALAERQGYHRATGMRLLARDVSARLTALKRQPETMWLRDMDAQALQQTLADQQRAFSNYFARRARYPRFNCRKRDEPRFRIPQHVTVEGRQVRVPKIGPIRARISREIEGTTKSATFKRQADGHWYVTIVAEVVVPIVCLPLPDPDRTVGVDNRGHTGATVVCSDGTRVVSPRYYRRGMRKLRRAQRALSRTKKGSHNREKARRHVARIHQKIANQCADHAHKLTTTLITNHQAVCIEDVNVRGLARTKLSLSIHDAALGMVRRQLEYKGQWYHRHVIVIGRWYPSSKRCHDCGYLNHALTLSDRTWTCVCGAVHDRDLNAALNIKDEGLRLLCVAAGKRRR